MSLKSLTLSALVSLLCAAAVRLGCGEQRLSALHVDGATHAAVGPNVCTAVEPEMLLDQYRLEHGIGVQFQHTAPERGLEDMAHMLARAELAGLNQKPCPFQRQKNAT